MGVPSVRTERRTFKEGEEKCGGESDFMFQYVPTMQNNITCKIASQIVVTLPDSSFSPKTSSNKLYNEFNLKFRVVSFIVTVGQFFGHAGHAPQILKPNDCSDCLTPSATISLKE